MKDSVEMPSRYVTHDLILIRSRILEAREILKGFGDGTIKQYDVEGIILLERLFGEGRRRSKVVPRFMGERSGLSLLFAVLVDASAGWHGVKITAAAAQRLDALRPHSQACPSSRLAA